jgi:tetratricopeptide (TPR) repeat protein
MKIKIVVFIFVWLNSNLFSMVIPVAGAEEKNNKAYIEEAQNYYYQGDFDKALAMYEGIIKGYPGNPSFRLTLAKIYIEKADFEKAKEHLLKALDISPNDAEAHFYLAIVFSSMGNYKQAIVECVKVLEINPRFYAARLLLADAYLYEFDDARSEVELKKLLAVTPESTSVYWRLGQLYSGLQGNLDKGIAEMEKVVSLKSDVSKLWGELGGLYLRSFKLQKAVESFSTSVKINPRNIESHYGLGQAYHYLDRLDEALAEYEVVLGIQPQNLWLLQGMAGIYYKQAQYEKLRDLCVKGIAFYPDNPDFHFMSGVANYYLMRGKEFIEKAKEQFEITLRLNANYPQAKEWLQMVSKALNDNKAIADKLTIIQKTAHYVIRTDLPGSILDRLVKENMADMVFEDAKAFVSKLLQKNIEIPPVTLSLFNKKKDYDQYYNFIYGTVGGSLPSLNEVIICGSDYTAIESILFHETVHVMLEKNLPKHYQPLCEALAGAMLFDGFWGIQADSLGKLITSAKFDTLDEKAILDGTQEEQYVYHAFGKFLIVNHYKELQKYLQLLQENKDPPEAFYTAFQGSQPALGYEFREFIKDAANKVSVLYALSGFDQRRVSYELYHSGSEPEDILIYMLSGYQYRLAKALLLENNVTAERLKSFVKKGNKPYYVNFSQEAERLLLLASEKLRGKKKAPVSIDEYVLTLLEDNNNKVAALLKEMGIDTLSLRNRLLGSLEKFKGGEGRFFSLVPKTALAGTSVTLFYWLLPEDKEAKVLLNDSMAGALLLPAKDPYEKNGLMRSNLKIPDTLKTGPYNFDITLNGKVIQNVPLSITDQLPIPLVEKLIVSPDEAGGVLFRNLSRLKFYLVYWDKRSTPLFSFKQDNKIFLAEGTKHDDYFDTIFSVDIPREVEAGDVEIRLQAVFGKGSSEKNDPIFLKVLGQKSPKIISFDKHTFYPGEKIVIKGENFAGGDKANSVIIGSCTMPASVYKKPEKDDYEDLEGLLSQFRDSLTQTLEVEIPKDKGLQGKVPVKVKVYDKISDEAFIEILEAPGK